jgi:hypothetical protein
VRLEVEKILVVGEFIVQRVALKPSKALHALAIELRPLLFGFGHHAVLDLSSGLGVSPFLGTLLAMFRGCF